MPDLRLAALAGGAVLGLSGCTLPEDTAAHHVTGTVVYRERILLNPPAVVTVTLADTSLADAPAQIVDQQIIPDVTTSPIKFALLYDPRVIDPSHTYTVSARIEVQGRLRFITDTQHRVITGGAPTAVELVAVAVP